MMLIDRRALLVVWSVVLIATGFLGVFGYHSISSLAGSSQGVFEAQQFLYVALLVFLVEGVLFLRMLLRGRNIQRELDKLIDITRFRGLSQGQNLSRLGPLGDQIHRLYNQLNDLSERKTLKISSLSELTEFLMNNLAVPAAAATVDGKVAYVSRALTERLKRGRNELIDERLDELAPGLSVPGAVAELERSHSSIQHKGERSALTLYPIRNAANQLAYIVCIFQGNSALVEQVRRTAVAETRISTFGGGVRRILDFGRHTAQRMAGDRPVRRRRGE